MFNSASPFCHCALPLTLRALNVRLWQPLTWPGLCRLGHRLHQPSRLTGAWTGAQSTCVHPNQLQRLAVNALAAVCVALKKKKKKLKGENVELAALAVLSVGLAAHFACLLLVLLCY